MEDRNKDLSLIVSEILIEMQQIRQEMQQDRNENSRLMLLLMDENRKNTEQMLQVFNRGFDMLHTRIDQVDERLERVERKQDDKR
jgi:predicted secreted protein